VHAEGSAAEVRACGSERFAELTRGVGEIARNLQVVDTVRSSDVNPIPAWVGGFAFDDDAREGGVWRGFPAARLVLPERMLVSNGRHAVEHRATAVAPGEDADRVLARLLSAPPRRPLPAGGMPESIVLEEDDDAAHLTRLGRALQAVRHGELEKLVVAHRLTCRATSDFDADSVLAALRARHPECRIFAVGAGPRTFLGASPERLLRVAEGVVAAEALAGSAPRSRDPEEDEALARELRESKKEQEEHAVVVRALHAALAPVCRDLQIAEAPGVRRLSAIQHLHTPARGRLRPGIRSPLLTLAARLHPTPAVSGAPGRAARDWLRRNEDLERGWYAGAVGWMDLEGQGELAVALRSALLCGGEARVFAGAGVVVDSDPLAELRETRLKLGAALGALQGADR
jgi:salicylate biosynthesis isochorismate synthase/menaquinone-specific isochorismate synthase